MQSEIVDHIVKPLVQSGIYKDEAAALRDITIDFIDRKRKEYDAVISQFQEKYHKDFDAFTESIKNYAGLQAEDDWMEWKGAIEMKKSWQEAYRIVIYGEAKAV